MTRQMNRINADGFKGRWIESLKTRSPHCILNTLGWRRLEFCVPLGSVPMNTSWRGTEF